MNNPTKEHLENVAFLKKFKEANAGTQYKSYYDPVTNSRVFRAVKIDPNAFEFAKQHVSTESDLKNKNRAEKAKSRYITKVPEAPKIPKPKPEPTPERTMPKKPKGQTRLNILRLRSEGKKFKEIGAMYGVSEASAKAAYHKEKKENENSSNAG